MLHKLFSLIKKTFLMTSCVTVGMTLSYSLNIPLLHTEGKNPSVKDTPVRPRLYILWMFSRIWKSYNKSQWVWFLGHRQEEGGQRRQGSTNERNGKSLKLHLCFAFFLLGFLYAHFCIYSFFLLDFAFWPGSHVLFSGWDFCLLPLNSALDFSQWFSGCAIMLQPLKSFQL